MSLTRIEEIALIERAQSGDQHATTALLEAHEPFIRALVARFPQRSAADAADLLQEARVGFLVALDSFDPERVERFVTKARWHAAKAVRMAVASSADIAIPDRTLARYLAAWQGADTYADAMAFATTGDRPMGAGTFAAVYSALHEGFSMDSTPDDAAEGGATKSYHETLGTPAIDSSGTDLAHALLSALPSDLHRSVIRYAYGMETGEPMIDSEVADALGLSRQKVQRLRVAAIEQMHADTMSTTTASGVHSSS